VLSTKKHLFVILFLTGVLRGTIQVVLLGEASRVEQTSRRGQSPPAVHREKEKTSRRMRMKKTAKKAAAKKPAKKKK
jgi:hypothetical protein